MRVRGLCAALVMTLFVYSTVFSAFAETVARSPVNGLLDFSSQSAPMPNVGDSDGASAAKARLAPTNVSPENPASGIPACDAAYARPIGEQSERRTAFLGFDGSSMVNAGYPGYANHQQLGTDAVNANFSNLSTNVALRGRYCTTQFGSTKVTAAVGMFADDWAALVGGQAPMPTRDAAAAKVEHNLDANVKAFFTVQGYQYDHHGASAGQLGGAQSVTTGLDYRKGRFGLVGEVGGSRREDGLQNEQEASAATLDGSWQVADNVTLRLGHRNLGRNYTTLSGIAAPGMRETYTGAKWNATSWLSLDTDVRQSLNSLATDAVARDTVAISTSATIAIPHLVGWGFNLKALQSAGNNSDGSGNDLTNYGAAVRYANGKWQTGLGLTQGSFDNARTSSNGTITGFNYDVAILWNDVMASVPPSWNARFTFGTAYQHQDFEGGMRARNANANVGVAVQHENWGVFSAAIARGRVVQLTGANVDSQSYQSEFSRPLSKTQSLKVYYRATSTVDYNTASEIRDQGGGLQFVLAQ